MTSNAVTDPSAPSHDVATWRVVGDPLVAPTGAGPLSGTTMAVKDLYAVAGHAVGAGNAAFLDEAEPAAEHAEVVGLLLSAGVAVRGISRTDEFAYSMSGTNVHYGSPLNPWSPDRAVGGSSNGSASATARGLVDIGLGTDTAGSVRVPASYCGLFGIRTTHGLVPLDGVLPLAPSFDTVGWMTRDADLLDRVARCLIDEGPDDPPTPIGSLVIADDLCELADPSTAVAVVNAAGQFAVGRGIPLARAHLLDGVDAGLREAFRVVQSAEAWSAHGRWITAHPGVVGPGIRDRFAFGAGVTRDQEADARGILAAARATIRDRIPAGTAIVMPAASGSAPLIALAGAEKTAMRSATLALTTVAATAGLPVAVAPAGTVDGLPVGIALMGAPQADLALTSFLSTRGLR
ncbi:MAG TPA: amidase family protein [Actinopolymorphaceae bacterium]|jgi:Asp-tRNA(Asn)/Glu-tRNA(Gln) amidotransferase A subunit family amidase